MILFFSQLLHTNQLRKLFKKTNNKKTHWHYTTETFCKWLFGWWEKQCERGVKGRFFWNEYRKRERFLKWVEQILNFKKIKIKSKYWILPDRWNVDVRLSDPKKKRGRSRQTGKQQPHTLRIARVITCFQKGGMPVAFILGVF